MVEPTLSSTPVAVTDLPDAVPARPTSRRARAAAWLVRAVTVVVLAAVIDEAALRFTTLGPQRYETRRTEPADKPLFAVDEVGHHDYLPGIRFAHVYDPRGDRRGYMGPLGRIEYRTNSLGIRGPEIDAAKPPGWLRILALGDSCTFGEGVREEDAWPAVLERRLADAPAARVRVVNAGVQAYHTMNEAVWLERRGLALRPDVVLLGFFLNDATETEAAVMREPFRALEAPRPWPARYSRLADAVHLWRAQRRLQREYFDATRASFDSERWEMCRLTLKYLRDLGPKQGFRFGVLVFPILYWPGGRYPFDDLHARVVEFCRAERIPVLDLAGALRAHPHPALWVHAADQHPNETAHRIIAEQTAPWLRRNGLLPEDP